MKVKEIKQIRMINETTFIILQNPTRKIYRKNKSLMKQKKTPRWMKVMNLQKVIVVTVPTRKKTTNMMMDEEEDDESDEREGEINTKLLEDFRNELTSLIKQLLAKDEMIFRMEKKFSEFVGTRKTKKVKKEVVERENNIVE